MDLQVAIDTKNQSESQISYASFHRRVIALTVDAFLLTFIMVPTGILLDYLLFDQETIRYVSYEMNNFTSEPNGDLLTFLNKLSAHSIFLKIMTKQILLFLVMGIIIVSFWWKTGTTPGKWIMECKILNEDDLTEPSKARYVKRYLAYVPSNLLFCLGFMLLGFDKKKRAWHDRMVGTVVIVKKHNWNKVSELLKTWHKKLWKQ